MKKSSLIIVALVVVATILFVPVTAKVTDPPPGGPVNDIVTLLTDILTALGLLQNDVAEIKSATTGNIVYTSDHIHGTPPGTIRIQLGAPGITEDVDVEIQTWWTHSSDHPYENTQECGTDGHITLTSAEQSQYCDYEIDVGSNYVRIIVQEADSYKIVPSVIIFDTDSSIREEFRPADLKVDQM